MTKTGPLPLESCCCIGFLAGHIGYWLHVRVIMKCAADALRDTHKALTSAGSPKRIGTKVSDHACHTCHICSALQLCLVPRSAVRCNYVLSPETFGVCNALEIKGLRCIMQNGARGASSYRP
uniref:Uncharacterized protein n=1 Tax=Eutreptiella gymnastica TaxID=73025 RepID=A0A7S4CK65_9EUGL